MDREDLLIANSIQCFLCIVENENDALLPLQTLVEDGIDISEGSKCARNEEVSMLRDPVSIF